MTRHRFVDRDMFARFAGIGVGHEAQFSIQVNSGTRDDLELDEEPPDMETPEGDEQDCQWSEDGEVELDDDAEREDCLDDDDDDQTCYPYKF